MKQVLFDYGFGEQQKVCAEAYPHLFPARVITQHRQRYRLIGEQGELDAQVSGKFAYEAGENAAFPAVGDWVMIDRIADDVGDAVIHAVLPRKSCFTRSAAGKSQQSQIIAANIDYVFLCMSANEDFSLRRAERYLSAVWQSGATPVVLLTKTDLCEDPESYLYRLYPVCGSAEVIALNDTQSEGLARLQQLIQTGVTVAFTGSSGVGKSTLINRLLGQSRQETKDIRADGKGRHTTTSREMIHLPQGGVLIDTPGMREFQLDAADLSQSFEDVEALISVCKFSDCTHTNEPGCAVRAAIESGTLDKKRFESYCKLQKETEYDGMGAKQREYAKIEKMFGSKKEMKRLMNEAKNKNKSR